MSSDTLIPVDWDDSDYLARYPDVARAVELKQLASGWQHYARYGQVEGRRPGGRFTPPEPAQTRNCLDPWRYLEITPALGVKPCCNFEAIGTWAPDACSLEDLRNAGAFQSLRRQLLTCELSDACRKCHLRPMVPLDDFRAEFQSEYGSSSGVASLMSRPLRELRLDVTTKCNLRCVYCAVSQPGYSAAEMAASSFDAIIALVSKLPRDVEIHVNGHGETTFHPDWLKLCRAIVELGFRPGIITNMARPLKDEEAACLAGFGRITVSLDTVDPVLLGKLRRRVKLANILNNIHKIRTAARARQAISPVFWINCGVYDANYAHLEGVAAFCVARGIQGVTFWQLVKYDDLADAPNVYPITSLDNIGMADAIRHLESAIRLLHQNGITTEVAGGFLDEWRRRMVPQLEVTTACSTD